MTRALAVGMRVLFATASALLIVQFLLNAAHGATPCL